MNFEIDTASKRQRLVARKNPYWKGISGGRGGVSLGYRKPYRGPGVWIGKIVVEGARFEERISEADDDNSAPGAMPYRTAVAAALEWSKRQHAAIEGRREAGTVGKGPTIRTAVEAYIRVRKRRSKPEGEITEGRMNKHILSDGTFSDTLLAKLRAKTVEEWRDRLPVRGHVDPASLGKGVKVIAPATLNRLLNDLRAALNAAAERHRRELPAHLPQEIKVGTKALSIATDARKQILTDQDVRRIVEAAFELNDDGDFGLLVMLAAATGARYSQLVRLRVGDVQLELGRIQIPGSKKGRAARARAPVSVPLSDDVLARLTPAVAGRSGSEPLLMRWAFKKSDQSAVRWERDCRRSWGPAYEVDNFWLPTVKAAGLPADTIMYALRHSSIVRGLRVGLPIRLVAALHDTSSEMIEAHYSAYIVDATEELARRASFTFATSVAAE